MGQHSTEVASGGGSQRVREALRAMGMALIAFDLGVEKWGKVNPALLFLYEPTPI